MSRKPLIRTSEFYYHVTSRTNNRDWFDIPMHEVWSLSLDSLKFAQSKYVVEIVQFVLMGNHYHLLIKTPDSNIDLFMYEFNKRLTLHIRLKTMRENKILGGRYKWSLITTDAYFFTVYRYIYQNPLRAGIVSRCEEYPFSTLYYENNYKNELVSLLTFKFKSIVDDFTEEVGCKTILDFINTPFSEENLSKIKKGMKKTTFKLVSSRSY